MSENNTNTPTTAAENEIKSSLGAGKVQDSAVNVIVKHDHSAMAADEIDLLHIFVNMGVKRRIYAWLIILCMLVGLSAPLLMAFLEERSEKVTAVITLSYDDAKNLLAPDGTALDLNYITSSYVLQNAVNATKLSENISLRAIAANVKIEVLLSESTRQQLEVMSQVQNVANKNAGIIEEVNNVEYDYENQVIVTMTNGFSNGDDDAKKVFLEGAELSALLNNIVREYSVYFFDKYNDWKLPDPGIANIERGDMDYVEQLDEITAAVNSLSRYCTDKDKGEYLFFRSQKDGMSFDELNNTIKMVSSINVNYLYSYIYYRWISKDLGRMLTKLNYNERTLQRDYATLMENIETNAGVIENYRNDNILIATQDGQTTQFNSAVTDYYNEQVLLQADYLAQKAELTQQIANLNDKIEGFGAASVNTSVLDAVDAEMNRTYEICLGLYERACDLAEEIISSDAYRSHYMTIMESTYHGEGALSAATVKKALMGMAIGAVAGLFVWCCDGLVTELALTEKKSGKEEEV